MRHLLIVITVLLPLLGCHSNKQRNEADYFIIRGSFNSPHAINLKLFELTTNDLITVDSFKTDASGSFSYRGDLAETSFFVLQISHKDQITLLIEPGEELFVNADARNIAKSYSVDGSEGSHQLMKLYRSLECNQNKLDSIKKVYSNKRDHEDFPAIRSGLKEEYRRIFNLQQQIIKQFINDNPRSLVSIIAIYEAFGQKQLMTKNDNLCYFEMLSRSLSAAYPTNKHVMDLNLRLSRYKRNELRRQIMSENLAVGNTAPEILLPDPSGVNTALSALRGNYVLIDFWASWCTPCREANQQLARIYNTYKSFGFEIYGISLDRTKEKWLQGIKEDNITWTQVSDLRSWNSPVVSLYNVKRIPHTVLICPEGKIIQKGISVSELNDYIALAFDSN